MNSIEKKQIKKQEEYLETDIVDDEDDNVNIIQKINIMQGQPPNEPELQI